MHLKCSNGSLQSRHVNDALQAVEPKALIMLVLELLHKGHGTTLPSPVKKALSWLDPIGGAMPLASILRLVSSEIQSVVQAGDIEIFTSAFGSTDLAAFRESSEITSVAGQPE